MKSEECEVSRWMLYKARLENLTKDEFFIKANEDIHALLLDVRTPEEYNSNLVDGALNLNYLSHNLADELEALDNSKTYYVFCRTGRRSLRVCMLMKNSGFRVINLDGGMMTSDSI